MNNKTLFKLHGWVGLFAFLPLLVICLTGSVLVFKYELENIIRPHMVTVPDQGLRLPMDTLKDNINGQFESHEIVGWVLFQNPERSDVVYLMPKGTDAWRHIYVNGFDGSVLSSPAKNDDFLTDWLLELHANFLLDDTGLVITTIYSLLLIILGVTGLMLYKKFWKTLLKIRWNARRILFFSDFHKQVGFFSAPIFLVLGITGVYWNVAHLLHEYEHHESGESFVMQNRLYNGSLSIDSLQQQAQEKLSSFKTTYITFPYEQDIHFTFYGDVDTGNPLNSEYASSVTFNRNSGDFMSSYDIRSAPFLSVFLDSFRPLHFGLFGGMAVRVLWCVVGLMPLILSFTGVYMWFVRRKKKRAKKLRMQKLAANLEVAVEINDESMQL
ncbi:hypothetical protein A9Q73_00870 [Bermanella sp. 47_1433_sub80_T6]|nr:hypothetical protein A9Q73_00870 [Bermanella sp. 47_1433_sub80_T6]